MTQKLNRRAFVAAGVGTLASTRALGAGPQVITRTVRPVVVCSNNAQGNATFAVYTENGPQNVQLEPLLT
jgi:hypothetical protein